MTDLMGLAERCETMPANADRGALEDLCRAIHEVDPRAPVNGSCRAYALSVDDALLLLPRTAENHNLMKFSSGWTFRFHDTAQKMGERAAKEEIARMRIAMGYGNRLTGEPEVMMEKAIAEHWLEFMCLKASTPALALCAASLRALSSQMGEG